MKINIIGAGPAGLYTAILMLLRDPRHQITLYERNPADATFGFGVVFSDETLTHFLGLDPHSLEEITRSFAYWDEIEVRYKDARIRSGGHGFCGMSRIKLLNILQGRARSLGADLRFEADITDIDSLRDCDVLVGADGVNSLVRERYKDGFEPTVDMRQTRFCWLGTTKMFDAFTFIFRPNEHGWFYLHAYQYGQDQTTWLVETHDDTWKKAGLDKASEEETLRYLEEFYAPDLDGHRLISNKSVWRNFPVVKNKHWHFENVVLLGDAAHTAQFSIGSGTKIAMEGAAALVESLSAENNIPDALSAYQDSRENEIGALQASALVSLKWYENARRLNDMDPEQFAFNFLSRTKSTTYDNLDLRDPKYIRGVREWFAADVSKKYGGFKYTDNEAPPPMFTPFKLGDLMLANRVVVSPMCQYSAKDGTINDWHLVHLGSLATGGAALLYTEMTNVSREGRITPGCAGMYKPEHIEAWKRVVDFVHENSETKICMQIAHAGRKGSTKKPWEGSREDDPLDEGSWEVLSASPVPYHDYSPVPREMDRDDMDKVREDFANAAKMAGEAGFDVLEVHMAHGYLLSSFISPLSNLRQDEHGGSLENRMRFPLEVFRAVRQAWPAEKPISVRISATDWVGDKGLSGDDAVKIALLLRDAGCDIIDTSAGQTSEEAEPVYGRMFQTPFAEQIRNEAKIPTMAVGNITTPAQVNTIIAAGRADLCALARPHLSQPRFSQMAAAQYGFSDAYWPNQYLTAKDQSMRLAEKKHLEEIALKRELKKLGFGPSSVKKETET